MEKDAIPGAGRVVKALREKHGLTVAEMAERLGYGPEKLQRIEAGEEAVGVEVVRDLALALGERPELLILQMAMGR